MALKIAPCELYNLESRGKVTLSGTYEYKNNGKKVVDKVKGNSCPKANSTKARRVKVFHEDGTSTIFPSLRQAIKFLNVKSWDTYELEKKGKLKILDPSSETKREKAMTLNLNNIEEL